MDCLMLPQALHKGRKMRECKARLGASPDVRLPMGMPQAMLCHPKAGESCAVTHLLVKLSAHTIANVVQLAQHVVC